MLLVFSVARLVATLGVSAGVVYEAVLNLCRGVWESPYATRIRVDEVVVVRTSAPQVEFTFKLLKLLFACSEMLPPEKRLPEQCKAIRIVDVPVPIQDIVDKNSYLQYYNVVRRQIAPESIVDISGGRAAMGIAAARAAIATPYTILVTTIIPPEQYQATTTAQNKLRQYNIDQIIEQLEKQTCREIARKHPDIIKLLAQLVTGKAKTVQLAP